MKEERLERQDTKGESHWGRFLDKRSTVVGLISLGVVMYLGATTIPEKILISPYTFGVIAATKILGIVVFTAGVAMLILNYLGTSEPKDSKIVLREEERDPTTKEKTAEREYIFHGASAVQASAIVNAIRGTRGGAGASGAAGPVDATRSLEPESCVAYYRYAVEANKERLTREIAALGRRGNVNLVIGSVTTVF